MRTCTSYSGLGACQFLKAGENEFLCHCTECQILLQWSLTWVNMDYFFNWWRCSTTFFETVSWKLYIRAVQHRNIALDGSTASNTKLAYTKKMSCAHKKYYDPIKSQTCLKTTETSTSLSLIQSSQKLMYSSTVLDGVVQMLRTLSLTSALKNEMLW